MTREQRQRHVRRPRCPKVILWQGVKGVRLVERCTLAPLHEGGCRFAFAGSQQRRAA